MKPTRRDEILKLIQDNRAELERLGAKSLSVFGSVARDEAREDSDVDVLVEFVGHPTFDTYMDIKFYLEDLLGRKVDLGTPDNLKPRIKQRVLQEAIHVTGL